MEILILGGTQFVGRTITGLLKANEQLNVTLSNRGTSNPGLFPDLPLIKADRETDDMLEITSRDWDAVVDVSSYYPDSLGKLTKKLTGRVGRYIYVSTASVYQLDEHPGPHAEESPALDCNASERSDHGMGTYGKRKRACELELLSNEKLDSVIFRPSVIYGPHDPYDRHYYWLYRTKKNRPFIVPEKGIGFGNHTYVKDLARMIESSIIKKPAHTIYNSTTHEPVDISDTVDLMTKVVGGKSAKIIYTKAELEAKALKPGEDIPLWYGSTTLHLNHDRAKNDFDFAFTPIKKSYAEWADWCEEKGWPEPTRGMSLEKEKSLL